MKTIKILLLWVVTIFAYYSINAKVNIIPTQEYICNLEDTRDIDVHDFKEYHDLDVIDFLDSLSHRDINIHDISVKEAKEYLEAFQFSRILEHSVLFPRKDMEKILELRSNWLRHLQTIKPKLQILKFQTTSETMVVIGFFVKRNFPSIYKEIKNRFYLAPGTEFIMLSSDGTCFAGMNGDYGDNSIYGFYHSPEDGDGNWVIDKLKFKTSAIYYDKKPTTQLIKGDVMPLPSLSPQASFFLGLESELSSYFYDGEDGSVCHFLRGELVEEFKLRIYPDPNILGGGTNFRSYFSIDEYSSHEIEVDLWNGGHVSGSLIFDGEMSIEELISNVSYSSGSFFPFRGTFTYPHGEKVSGEFVDCEEGFDKFGGPRKLVQFGKSSWYTYLPYPGNTTLSDNKATFLPSSTIKEWIGNLDFLEGVLLSQNYEEIKNITELYEYIEDRINQRLSQNCEEINSATELYEYIKENYPTEFYEYIEDRIKQGLNEKENKRKK